MIVIAVPETFCLNTSTPTYRDEKRQDHDDPASLAITSTSYSGVTKR
jgi:hypothetical protein